MGQKDTDYSHIRSFGFHLKHDSKAFNHNITPCEEIVKRLLCLLHRDWNEKGEQRRKVKMLLQDSRQEAR